ncbi:hypothetical protein A3A84_02445 [Candidatus Collierbacteria bacterium RIFCSPLOWO2_01_FULL_50_23]|uniref:Uncharacterized protein n=2 Tax=Candidatus Collieribacteriota TaxID=1752725 RepID=A0A1F5EX40_9BACT|nr:MAG: hypothetical protein A3D09_00860 [Candidatus Collierbacteria bacterium RIFCSPHIGHO2_02_FULL_49_10]OGD72260.1 MAG: hypothetical protein A2703_02755 [Candidatus Collierbacteria bacterium RIFCSPHIGHO2_01_FULL_50_25]OGD73817.1 MAG: hypothetical protein A3A84_02445 [Candidatus Collierbacteria bacterium RIFCSPLOWO2_01_FULL_50_23]
MLSIAHATTGAFIATKIPNPYLSIPLILASHFLEDYIPHWDVGQGLSKKNKGHKDAFLQELFTDFPASILLVFFFFQYGQPFSIYPWLGWFFALLPDFIEFPYLFLGWRFTPIKQLAAFHKYFHHSTPEKLKGLLPQVVLILLIYILR